MTPMSNDDLTQLLPAIDIAAFRRTPDGSFTPLAPAPGWFGRLVADVTFPFLGHILEEATLFWRTATPGAREFGPAVEVNEAGHEFHYRVLAVTVDAGQFLVFELDPGTDRLREVLRQVRGQALVASPAGVPATIVKVQQEVRRTSERMHDLLRPLLATGLRDPQFELWQTLSAACEDLVRQVDALAGVRPPSDDPVDPSRRIP
jgi:hypothetical protein